MDLVDLVNVESSETPQADDILRELLNSSTDDTFKKPASKGRAPDRLTQLPLSRVKAIVKSDPSVNIVSHEAVLLITKATELFVDSFAKEIYKYTARAKRKTIQRKDIDAAIETIEQLCFLEGLD